MRSLAALVCCCASIAAADIELAALKVPTEGRSGFTPIAPTESGIQFTNHLSDLAARRNRIYELGSGVALGDVDGDGLCDIYLPRMEGDNALYRNLGNWKFEDVTAKAGVACPGQFSTGAVFADVDADGDLDLLVTGIGSGTRLFKNDGKGVFTSAQESGLAARFGATSMALADVDADGDLDLYVCNYRTTTTKDNPSEVRVEARRIGDKIVVTPEDRFEPVVSKGGGVIVVEKGEPDFLYLNDGKGRFTPVSWTEGNFRDEDGDALTKPPRDWALAAAFRDLNSDGLPDLYVCNDFFQSPDRVWMNQGKGIFRAIDRFALRNMSMSSMSVDFADINRDGFDDFFVADMLSPRNATRQRQRANVLKGDLDLPVMNPAYRPEVLRNTLCLNRGDGTFAEIAQLAGVEATEWTWGSIFLDVDLDGYEDLLLTTGNNHDVLDADAIARRAMQMPRLYTPSFAFRNNGDLTFSDKSAEWGFNFTGISQGIASADLDNDGDSDVVVNRMNSAAGLYRNETSAPRMHVRATIGARIKVNGAKAAQTQTIISGARYLSGDEEARVFAAGPTNTVEVWWPSGAYSRHEGVPANQKCVLRESKKSVAPKPPVESAPLFVEVPFENAPHVDDPFDDFARQPLLPFRLSHIGPALGFVGDHLFIGSGRGGRAQMFDRSLKPASIPWLSAPVTRDQINFAGTWLLASNYEDGLPAGGILKRISLTGLVDVVLATTNAPGAIAVARNGDVFIGGRVRPGRYPEAADSFLYSPDGTALKLKQTFAGLGLVTGAVFADLDSDGDEDIAVSREWSATKILFNENGVFKSSNALSNLTGLWTTIAAADIDLDGAVDLIVGNFGRNTKYQRQLSHPIRIYSGDLDGDGALEIIEAWHDAASNQYVAVRDFDSLSRAIPGLRERINTYELFGRASVEQLLAGHMDKMNLEIAEKLESCVLFNRNSRFEVQPLPMAAQFAPVMSIAVGDFNNDKRPDLFLSQNFFGVETETSRYDAGLGLLLLNLPNGFKALSAVESGIRIYGEQRAAIATDFDQDGFVDLIVAQNRGPVRVFRNNSKR